MRVQAHHLGVLSVQGDNWVKLRVWEPQQHVLDVEIPLRRSELACSRDMAGFRVRARRGGTEVTNPSCSVYHAVPVAIEYETEAVRQGGRSILYVRCVIESIYL